MVFTFVTPPLVLLMALYIETRLLREEMVKGKARPVKLYEVLAEFGAVPAAKHEPPVSVGLA